jgi:hypothetical protein
MTELYQKRCSDCRNYFLGSYWSFVHRCSLCTNRVLVREQEERDEKLRQKLEEINRQFDRPYYNPPVQRQQPARQVYTEELLEEPVAALSFSPVTHSDHDDDNNKLARYIMVGILAISFAVAGLYAMFHDPSQKRGLDASIERMNAIANSVNTPATDEKVADAVDRARAVVAAAEDEDSKLNAHVTELIKNADKPNSFLAEDDDADDEIEKLADEKIKES